MHQRKEGRTRRPFLCSYTTLTYSPQTSKRSISHPLPPSPIIHCSLLFIVINTPSITCSLQLFTPEKPVLDPTSIAPLAPRLTSTRAPPPPALSGSTHPFHPYPKPKPPPQSTTRILSIPLHPHISSINDQQSPSSIRLQPTTRLDHCFAQPRTQVDYPPPPLFYGCTSPL